jgi:hypothetical protein
VASDEPASGHPLAQNDRQVISMAVGRRRLGGAARLFAPYSRPAKRSEAAPKICIRHQVAACRYSEQFTDLLSAHAKHAGCAARAVLPAKDTALRPGR